MKNYMIILLTTATLLSGSAGFAQQAANQKKTVAGSPCYTMGKTVHHYKKHHAKSVAAVARPHKAVAHHHHAVKKEPIRPTIESISIDDRYSVAIVSIKNGEVYVNDSLLTTIKNPLCEDHKIIINYIAPPPPPPAPVTAVEHIATNTYTGEKAEGMLGVWGTSNCCEEGVVVDEVLPGGPACKAGIERGDVITKINDQKINDGNDLAAAMKTLSAGDNAAVTVRDYDGTETRRMELVKKDLPADCGGCSSASSACR